MNICSKNEEFQKFNGFMWSNSIGEKLTWKEAQEFAKNCKDGGFTDWRLPTAKELANTIDYEKGESTISRGTNGYYWSSTQVSSSKGVLLSFDSNYSFVYSYSKTYNLSVRCLRDIKGDK